MHHNNPFRIHHLMCKFLLALSLLLCPSFLHAAVYYVSTSGNDANSCGTAQACTSSSCTTAKRTLVSGLSCLSAGDTMDIRAGTYTEGDSNYGTLSQGASVILPSGTSSARVVIQGHTGETVTLTNSINVQDNIDSSVVSYVTFDHVTMPFFRAGGNTNHLRLSNSTLTGNVAATNTAQVAQSAAYIEFIG